RTLALWAEPLPGAPAAILLDLPTGLWLWAGGFARGRAAGAAARAGAWLGAAGWAPETVLAEAAFAGGMDGLPGAHALSAEAGDADPRIEAILARRPQLRGDLDFLAAPALGLPRAADLALSVAVQGMLREVAARLQGFGASSLPYLHARFLDLGAVVEVEPERWVARLGRPPLQFVLSASGLARGEHHPTWLSHPVSVCQEEGP
ncbi:MAG TPA: hypothetical protein VM890_00220, partial [Longimicrobium sp.]|nr:hypothetical protein [Longimicrobium sp.]